MLNNIYFTLEKLGLTAQNRVMHLQFSNSLLSRQVFLQRIDGTHAINAGIHLQLICLSTNGAIPLKQFIGSQVAIDIVNDQSELNRISGIVTKADMGASDGSLTIYRLTVEDPTALWKHRRNSRVFMAKSAVEVIQTVFQEWVRRSSLFASSLTLDMSGLTKDYDVRPFIMQASESDFNFLIRLMKSENISYLIDEAKLKVSSSSEQIQPQKLRLIDDNSQYTRLERQNIRFHRSSAVEHRDSIISLVAERSLQPTSVHIHRWQADAHEIEEGAGHVQSNHQHSENYDNASLGLEQVWHFSPAWIQDLNGEDGVTQSGNSQIEKFNENLSHYYDSQAKQFTATSTVRDAHVGQFFELDEHPVISQLETSDKQFLIVSKQFYNQNNLPKDLTDQVDDLIKRSLWQTPIIAANNPDERQANQLLLQRRHIAVVPEYNPLLHRPTAYPLRAIVVGPSGEEIYVDEWGRIKVRFLFTRTEDNTHDGGAGSNDNDTDSAWVDVLTPWAGEGYGARFLPRVGEVVVIEFFGGDIDRPFVVGRIHEAHRHPTKFDDKGKLPETKKLSGIKSKEYKGGGYNQLRFDDSTGQISAQLQSSHGASQLNLGKLSHPKYQAESDDRGEGFELRTDEWGAIRAAKGLFVSTDAQLNAADKQLDIDVAIQRLEQALEQVKMLQKGASQAKADPKEGYTRYPSLQQQLDDQLKTMAKPNILISTPTGIAVTTPKSHTYQAGESITMFASKQIDLSSMGQFTANSLSGMSLYAQQGGMKVLANQGEVQIQAQNDALQLAALKDISITSSQGSVTIAVQNEITLGNKSGGYIKIKTDGSIEIGSPALVEVKSQMFNTLGAATLKLPLPSFQNVLSYNESFKLLDPAGTVIRGLAYQITGMDTDVLGETSDTGLSDKVFSLSEQQIQFDPVWYELVDDETSE
ncbi:type VI secretion system tip protein VgrG [Acinetobacter bereziniae]|uniref:type VI secretion system Vgr family protein n=1 Tax=Acinetobacter bereziniae TaxID=106648 RepID=UPI0018FF3C2B|nr:type VI secretion system Vgr family protein [Acinetobacter bereziniae]MBJ8451880.1 type VI secretion system tip protein VgrG [Acinetobacter bereziniae]MBJ8456070.1 type VI secretion system tip protein VgrG [Acinetobacter bereziniae]